MDLRSKASSADIISPHKGVHAELNPYSELMLWLKECNPVVFASVLEVGTLPAECNLINGTC